MYKRASAYFNSGVFELLLPGLISLISRKGKILLACGPELQKKDAEIIQAAYEFREKIAKDLFEKQFEEALNNISDQNLKVMFEMISKEYLEIKVVYPKSDGIYHDKLGVLQDANGKRIVFFGSANETGSAYSIESNYEKIRVISDIKGENVSEIDEEEKEFDDLWDNKNKYLSVSSFKESALKIINNCINNRQNASNNDVVKLRDYQKQAIAAWVDNNFHGFYVMATGTGKTFTAIYSLKELFKTNPCLTVICAPYKHLVKQWQEDVIKVFPEAKIIMVSSENLTWTTELNNAIIKKSYDPDLQIIVISTIKSFATDKFDNIIKKASCEKVLVVDEAHRFKLFDDKLKSERYQYMLGLSATPGNGKNKEFVNQLLAFFGGKVFELTIEEAIGKFLVPYNYYPIVVDATAEEEKKFEYYGHIISSCFVNGVLVDKEKFNQAYRGRLRVLGMAQQKELNIKAILSKITEKNHFVVYCGDGKIYNGSNETIKHIQFVKNNLTSLGFKACQFTASENMDKRMELVDGFNKGEFDSLVAIRCLDEGINIPSIRGALILASNDDYREFVQRRGRILRQYDNKEFANIYDVVVLPSYDARDMALIELRRFFEYSRLAINEKDNMEFLEKQLNRYGIEKEELLLYQEMEDEIDE